MRGCTRKQEHTQANDVEAGFSRDQVRDLRSLPRQNSNPNPQRITRNQQIQNSLVPNDQLAFDDYDSTHSNERKDYINLQTRIDTPVSDTTEGTGSQSGPPEYETQSSLLLSND